MGDGLLQLQSFYNYRGKFEFDKFEISKIDKLNPQDYPLGGLLYYQTNADHEWIGLSREGGL